MEIYEPLPQEAKPVLEKKQQLQSEMESLVDESNELNDRMAAKAQEMQDIKDDLKNIVGPIADKVIAEKRKENPFYAANSAMLLDGEPVLEIVDVLEPVKASLLEQLSKED